jgi:hypothetical protein
MPEQPPNETSVSLQDSTLIEVANELRRLATDLLKDVRKSAALPGLSQIAAMRPLQNLLAEALAEKAFNSNDPEAAPVATSPEPDNWFGFGIRPRK